MSTNDESATGDGAGVSSDESATGDGAGADEAGEDGDRAGDGAGAGVVAGGTAGAGTGELHLDDFTTWAFAPEVSQGTERSIILSII